MYSLIEIFCVFAQMFSKSYATDSLYVGKGKLSGFVIITMYAGQKKCFTGPYQKLLVKDHRTDHCLFYS